MKDSITNKGQIASDYFLEGYNCSQCLLLAFQEELGINTQMAARLGSSLGGGMARLREVCGAVSGMFLVAGLLYGYDDPKDYEGKKEHYERIQNLAAKFEEKNGSIVCRELLGLTCKREEASPSQRTETYYKKRPCKDLVKDAAEIMEYYIDTHSGQWYNE